MAGPIRISILADDRASRVFTSVGASAGGVSARVGAAGRAMGAAFAAGSVLAGAAAVKFGVDAVKSASAAQQSLGATETVFGKYADTVIKRSNEAATAIGVSANEYRELSNVVGASLSGVGIPLEQVSNLTGNLNERAADMAATFGGTTKEAVEAVGSALRGETDPIERYGVSVKATDVAARLAATGQDQLTGSALKQAEMMARLDLIFEKTALTQGAFARESGTLANQQQVLGAQFEDLKAKIGTALLPVLTDLFTFLNTEGIPALTAVGGYLEKNFGPAFETVKNIISDFTSGSGSEITGWAKDVQTIVSDLVTIVTELWDTFGSDIIQYTRNALKNVQQIIGGGLDVIAGLFKVVSGLLRGDWSKVWEGIKQITSGAADVVSGLVKQLFNVIQLVVSAGWKVIKGLFATAWDGLTLLVSAGIDKAVGFVQKLPGRITGALGDLSGLLLNAGRQIIQGLLDGIESMIGAVRDKLGSVTDLIPDWKGPAERDRVLLLDAGRLIMQGLVDGIEDGRTEVQRTLARITDEIGSTFDGTTPTLRLRTTVDTVSGTATVAQRVETAAATRTSTTDPVEVNLTVVAPVGSSSADIGRELQGHLSAYFTSGGRQLALS